MMFLIMEHPNGLRTDDWELVEKCRTSADHEAFSELWRRYEPRIRAGCRRVLRDDAAAEDITQDTFLRALVHLERYRSNNFAGWLWRIAYHLCLNYLRSAGVRAPRAPLEEADAAIPVNGGRREDDIVEALLDLIETLPERQRIVLKMFYLEECSYAEIVRATGFSQKELKSAIQNGRRMLRLKWEKMQHGRT
ncbi:MAG: RNA polymerase sigma factor [Bryobacterales bacterium]|nr:RNA polymerase sigma factor [Bryobacterales bacterium]